MIGLSVGTTLAVSAGPPSTYDSGGFDALSYTVVGEVTNIGEFGGESQIAQHVALDDGIVVKRKGSVDYGTLAVQMGETTDAGQTALKSGFDGANAYVVHSFRVTNMDGDHAYFTGMVASYNKVTNDANTVTGINCNVEVEGVVLYAAGFTESSYSGEVEVTSITGMVVDTMATGATKVRMEVTATTGTPGPLYIGWGATDLAAVAAVDATTGSEVGTLLDSAPTLGDIYLVDIDAAALDGGKLAAGFSNYSAGVTELTLEITQGV